MGTPPSTPPPPKTDEPRSLFGVLLGVITSVQDWRRAGILVLLGAATLVGVLIWQARDRLIDDILRDAALDVAINEEIAPGVTQRLLGLKGAMLVSVWAMDLEQNTRKLVNYSAQTDSVTRILDDLQPIIKHGFPILFDAPDGVNRQFVRALNGELACAEPMDPTSPEVRAALAATGIHYTCILTIPPDASAAKGLLMVYFQTPLDAAQVAAIRPMLWTAAQELAHPTPTPEPQSRERHGALAATAAAAAPPAAEEGDDP